MNGVGPGKKVDFAGLKSLRNCLFLSVTLPLPSTLTIFVESQILHHDPGPVPPLGDLAGPMLVLNVDMLANFKGR